MALVYAHGGVRRKSAPNSRSTGLTDAEPKKPHTKANSLCESLYIKFRNRRSWPAVFSAGEGHRWGAGSSAREEGEGRLCPCPELSWLAMTRVCSLRENSESSIYIYDLFFYMYAVFQLETKISSLKDKKKSNENPTNVRSSTMQSVTPKARPHGVASTSVAERGHRLPVATDEVAQPGTAVAKSQRTMTLGRLKEGELREMRSYSRCMLGL